VGFGLPNQPNGPSSPSVTKTATAPASPAATAMRRGRLSATPYTPTMTGTSAAPSIWPSAAHGEAEHPGRAAVTPDPGNGRHHQQQVSSQRRMAGQVQATVVMHWAGLDPGAHHGQDGHQRHARSAPQRRDSLTTLLMPITRSVSRQQAGGIVAAQAGELPRRDYPLLPV
jgi:hypothetical protein